MTGFINAIGVTAGNNTSVISVTRTANNNTSVDFSHVVSGTAIYVDGVLYEGVSGTAPDPSGNSSVTVKENITPAIVSGSLKGFNTIEGLRDAISNARGIAKDLLELDSVWNTLLTGTTPTVEFELNGQTHTETPYQYLVDQFAAGNIVAQNATNADKIDIANKSTNSNFDIVFAGSDATSNAALVRDSASRITANPNSGTVNAISFNGSGRSSVETLSLGTSGNGNGFFTSDSGNGRTTFSAGQFYFTNSVSTFINYAPTQIYGDSGVVGQNLFRSNTLSGDDWSITGAGLFTGNGFVGDLTGNATSSTQSLIDNNTSSAAAYPVIWSDGRHSGNGNDNLYKSFGGDGARNLLFNPSTGILKAKGFEGNADSATTARVQSGSYTGQYDIIWSDTASNANLFRASSGKMQVQPSTGTITAAGGFVGDLSGQSTTSLGVYCVVSSSGSWYDMLANNDTTNVNTISSLRRSTGNGLAMQPSTGSTKTGGSYGRKATNTGYLTSHNSSPGSTNPIFCTDPDLYAPDAATLGTMYGIGYARGDSSFINNFGPSNLGWGMYVASAGTSRIFLDSDNGNISITGNLYGDVVGNADSSTKVTTTTNGSSSYYDILAHGLTGTGQGASTPTRAASGKLMMRPSDGKILTTGNIEVGGLIHSDDGFTSNGYSRLAGTVAGSNHHRGSYGTYVTTDKIHPIWGINTSWKLDSDGLGAGNYYGLSHVHTTGYGGDASTSSGNSWATFVAGRSQSQGVNDCKYAVQWTSNGDCKSLFGEAIWSQGNITTESNMIATGDITAGGSVYGTLVSDRSTKNTILAISDASEKVSLLSGNSYYYNEDRGVDGLQYGLIAQEVQSVLPEMVAEDSDGILRIKTGGLELTALLVEAHKEVSAKVDAQAELIENMMSRLEALENKP